MLSVITEYKRNQEWRSGIARVNNVLFTGTSHTQLSACEDSGTASTRQSRGAILLERNKDQLPRPASALAARLNFVPVRQRTENRYAGTPFSRGEHYFLRAAMSKLRLSRSRCCCPPSHQCNPRWTSLSNATNFRKNAVLFESSLTLAACPSDKSSMKINMWHRWKYYDSGRTALLGEKPVPMPLSTTNLTWTGPGSKPRLCGEIPSIPVSPHIVVHGNARNPHAGPLYIHQTRNGSGAANLTTHHWHIQ